MISIIVFSIIILDIFIYLDFIVTSGRDVGTTAVRLHKLDSICSILTFAHEGCVFF